MNESQPEVCLSTLTLTEAQEGVLMRASKLTSLGEIRDKLQPYYVSLVAYYENDLIAIQGDYRSGTETYGYADLESIQYGLTYISDRWRACFRVRWLIELINPRYCLWDGQRCESKIVSGA